MKFIFSVITCLTLASCGPSANIEHSFFIAGHTYGSPLDEGKEKGLYKPLMDKVRFINEQNNLDKGFLLGDVVWKPTYWPEAEKDILKFNPKIHLVKGNHDGNSDFYTAKFGKTYSKFIFKDNLYIILDSTLDKWNISGDQLVFLMNTLRNDGNKASNIFIMVHHLLWYSKDKFFKPMPNSTYGKAEETNFWNKIEPLLRAQQKPVYLFAGDMGAFPKEFRKQKETIEYFYHSYDNITFVGTGMGGGIRDNFVIVNIHKDQSVSFRLIHLNGDDIDGLGKLEDYQVNSKKK